MYAWFFLWGHREFVGGGGWDTCPQAPVATPLLQSRAIWQSLRRAVQRDLTCVLPWRYKMYCIWQVKNSLFSTHKVPTYNFHKYTYIWYLQWVHDLNFHFRRVLFLIRITRSNFGFMNLSVYALGYLPVYVLIARVFIAKVLYGRCRLTCCNGFRHKRQTRPFSVYEGMCPTVKQTEQSLKAYKIND